MTEQEKAKKLLPIIQAIAEGKKIQYSFNGVTWFDKDENLELQTVCDDIISDSTEYRIKPDERYVYKYDDKFVIMDVKIPLIKDSPLFEGSLEECNEWIKEQVSRKDVLEIEGGKMTEIVKDKSIKPVDK